MALNKSLLSQVILLIIGITIGFQSIIATAAEPGGAWSFKEHPHPERQDLTPAEMSLIKRVDQNSYANFYPDCLDSVDAFYMIYNQRYPDFAKQGSPAENFRAWKRHIMSERYPFYTICVGDIPYLALLYYEDETYDADIVFCGRYSAEPKSDIDRFIKSNIDEMLDYVLDGSRSIGFSFFLYNPTMKSVQLNPDVEYYFRKVVENDPDFRPEDWDTAYIVDKLTPERRAFVDDAAKRVDFRAVMETTQDCKPNEK